jgi:hypothetical protein
MLLLQNRHRQQQRSRHDNSQDRNMKSADFVVARDDLQQCKTIETQLPDADALPADALLVKVDRFAFTANKTSPTRCSATN